MKKVIEHCVEINRLRIRRMPFTASLGELFEDSNDTKYILRREIYDHMESATDRCEDVANVLEGVALKNA